VSIVIKQQSVSDGTRSRDRRCRSLLFLWVLAAPGFNCLAETTSGGLQALNPVLSVDQIRSDVRFIRDALQEGDPGLYRFSSRRAVEDQFELVTRHLDHPMTTLEFYRILAPAIGAFGDGHLQLQLSAAIAREFDGKPVLPLIVRVLRGKAFVLRDLSGATKSLSGARIDSINGLRASEIIDRLKQSLSFDGSSPSGREHDAGREFGRALLRLFNVVPPYDVTLWQRGELQRAVLHGVAQPTLTDLWRELYPHDQAAASGLSFPAANIALISVAHWDTGEEGSVDLSKKFKEWFATLKMRRIRSLIIDVRDNGGGEETLGTELLSYLVDHRFYYYRCAVLRGNAFGFLKYAEQDGTPYAELLLQYSRPSPPECLSLGPYSLTNRPNLGPQVPRAPIYSGAIYLLLNGGSFSTSAEFAANLRSHTNAILVGQTSSGAYYGNNSGITIPLVLPNSRLRLSVPTVAYYLAVRAGPSSKSGVVPDFLISENIGQSARSVDAEMAAVRALIEKRSMPVSR
jgi:hypothetical protein